VKPFCPEQEGIQERQRVGVLVVPRAELNVISGID
jgi:hypothetical protein